MASVVLWIVLAWVALHVVRWLSPSRRFDAALHSRQLSLSSCSLTYRRPLQAAEPRLAGSLLPGSWLLRHGRLLRLWFAVGAAVGLVVMAAGVALLWWHLFSLGGRCAATLSHWADHGSLLSPHSPHSPTGIQPPAPVPQQAQIQQVRSVPSQPPTLQLRPIVPGWTVPGSHWWVFGLALLVTGILHEYGHYLAARLYQIQVDAVGLFVTLVYPGAFVELKTQQLAQASCSQRLSVTSAGIWHNLIVALAALACWQLLPLGLSPLYRHGAGLLVLDVPQTSPLYGTAEPADIFTVIDGSCNISDKRSWHGCMQKLMSASSEHDAGGLCTRREVFLSAPAATPKAVAEGIVDCCDATSAHLNSSGLCFADMSRNTGRYRCLAVRPISNDQNGRPRCHTADDCAQDQLCARITLEQGGSLQRLVRIDRGPMKAAVLYFGPVSELEHSCTFSEYLPRFGILATLPLWLELLCVYLLVISPAVAVLNAIPCWSLDGQYMFDAVVEYCLGSSGDPSRRESIVFVFLSLHSLILLIVILLALASAALHGS